MRQILASQEQTRSATERLKADLKKVWYAEESTSRGFKYRGRRSWRGQVALT
jgi:hypothetical protein